MNHIEFEKRLMEKLLNGNDLALEGLRNQYAGPVIESRKFSGAGFFTHFRLHKCAGAEVGGNSLQIGDVDASTTKIKEALSFILFIEKGYLSVLEGYTLSSDTCPDEYSEIRLNYDGPVGILIFKG